MCIRDSYKDGATVKVHALNETLPENGLYSNAMAGSDRMELYLTVNAAGDQMMPVSYTHLDVYKRQRKHHAEFYLYFAQLPYQLLAVLPGAEKPVSYTHLDVYKRQVYPGTGGRCREPSFGG